MTLANTPTPHHVDFLILGAGWTSTFLLPVLDSHNITHAATTRAGSPTTIAFNFDPESTDPTPYNALPSATTVLITFPIKVTGGTKRLVDLYTSTHPGSSPRFIQLGTSSVWNAPGTSTRHTAIDPTHERGIAETELLSLGGCVLNLSGLWGGARSPQGWVSRVADSKEKLAGKGSLHLIHGEDVTAAVVAVHGCWEEARGQRWLLTDMRSYDWWDLALAWGMEEHKRWVMQLLEERGTGVLPRSVEEKGRALDSSEFWRVFRIWPQECLLI